MERINRWALLVSGLLLLPAAAPWAADTTGGGATGTDTTNQTTPAERKVEAGKSMEKAGTSMEKRGGKIGHKEGKKLEKRGKKLHKKGAKMMKKGEKKEAKERPSTANPESGTPANP